MSPDSHPEPAMPRRLPTATLSVGLAVVFCSLLPPARGDTAAPAAGDGGVKVRIDRVETGPPVEGLLKLPALTLKTDIGSSSIDWSHVRRVTFQKDPGGAAYDSVQLADKTIVRGRVTQDEFVVGTADGEKTFRREEVREIRPVRAESAALLTVLLGLLTLTVMEVVLGIDNVIFLAIVTAKLPPEQQPKARKIGLAAALGMRLVLLFTLSLLLGLTRPVFTLPTLGFLYDLEAREVSVRDLILLFGGLFLIGKSVYEMHEKLERAGTRGGGTAPAKPVSFARVIFTIAVIDIVFSLDSVITAVGMVDQLWVMVVAMVVAMGVMLAFAGGISRFVEEHPTVKILALSFMILIGVMLVAEGLGQHMNKGYIYFAMAFAVGVELVNMRLRKGHAPAPAATATGSPPAG
jgi:predicted tellurium resistance membrane protein TerC